MPAIAPHSAASFLAPYRRITSSGTFIPEVDGLRFAAIFCVFIYHLTGDILRHSGDINPKALQLSPLFPVAEVLNIGVQLFFTISGFILALPFATAHLHNRPSISLKKYFLRRLTRLEPPYLLTLICFFVLKVLGERGSPGELFPHLLASTLYLHNWIFGAPSRINFVAWSLEIEIQFYLLAPLLALIFAIRSPKARRITLVSSTLLFTGLSLFTASSEFSRLSLIGNCQYFIAGFILAEVHLSGGTRAPRLWNWDLVFLFSGGLLLLSLIQGGSLVLLLSPWFLLLLALSSFRGIAINHIVVNIWITTLGGMCYTIYLLHNYLIAALGMITESMLHSASFGERLTVQFFLMGPAVIVICALFFRLIERPCMRPDWPRRFVKWFESPRSTVYIDGLK